AAPRCHPHGRVRLNAQARGVGRMNLDIQILRTEPPQNFGFAGAGLRVPLGAAPAARKQDERKLQVRLLGNCARLFINKFRSTVGMVELAILEQTPFARGTTSFQVPTPMRLLKLHTRFPLTPALSPREREPIATVV